MRPPVALMTYVNERPARTLPDGAIDQLLDGEFSDRFIDAEAGRICERENVDERTEIARRRFAQVHGAPHQRRQRSSPVGGT